MLDIKCRWAIGVWSAYLDNVLQYRLHDFYIVDICFQLISTFSHNLIARVYIWVFSTLDTCCFKLNSIGWTRILSDLCRVLVSFATCFCLMVYGSWFESVWTKRAARLDDQIVSDYALKRVKGRKKFNRRWLEDEWRWIEFARHKFQCWEPWRDVWIRKHAVFIKTT